MENEIWKPIIGYEGLYEISNLGRIKSLEKIVIGGKYKCKRIVKEKILNKNIDISLSKNNTKKTFDLNTLVKIHFNGFVPKGDRKLCVINNEILTKRQSVSISKSKIKNKTSKYIGVSFNKKANKFRAMICINKKDIHLGLFITEEEANIIYQKAVKYEYLYKGIPKYFRLMLNNIH